VQRPAPVPGLDLPLGSARLVQRCRRDMNEALQPAVDLCDSIEACLRESNRGQRSCLELRRQRFDGLRPQRLRHLLPPLR
jgi:hypothetical protein